MHVTTQLLIAVGQQSPRQLRGFRLAGPQSCAFRRLPQRTARGQQLIQYGCAIRATQEPRAIAVLSEQRMQDLSVLRIDIARVVSAADGSGHERAGGSPRHSFGAGECLRDLYRELQLTLPLIADRLQQVIEPLLNLRALRSGRYALWRRFSSLSGGLTSSRAGGCDRYSGYVHAVATVTAATFSLGDALLADGRSTPNVNTVRS